MKRNALAVLIALWASIATSPAYASDNSMRCGRHLIVAGGNSDSSLMYEVLKKCGEPEAKQGNSWVYSQGNMQRILTFNYESRLQRIESRRK